MLTIKSKIIATGAILGALAVPIAASAAPSTYHKPINEHWRNQEHRINHGVRTGQLTGHEAAQLQRHEAQVRWQEARDRRYHHGHLTAAEQRHIRWEQERLNHRIWQQKHDRQHR